MRELYVYYRVEPAHIERARLQLDALRTELATARPRLRMRVLRRDDAGVDGAQTWMEIYVIDAGARSGGVDREIEDDIERRAARLLTAIVPPRHCEAFIASDD
jgi:hypothetical protein